jgi:predicted RND superfamily exporter protein
VPRVTKVAGFADTIKRVNQVFNVDEPPDGIAARPQAAYNSETSDFGFGDFGFEDDEGGSLPPVSSPLTRSSGAPLNGGAALVTPPSSAETPLTFAMLTAAAGKKANMSANELVRELDRMTNYEGRAYYEIPADPARYGKQTDEELQQLIANYLVPLAGSENGMLNDPLEPTAVKTTILINSQWTKDTDDVIQAVNEYVEANFSKNVRVITGGVATQQSAMSNLIFHSQVISLLLSLLIVLIIVAFSYKSLAAGLIAALPLSIAILGNFAVMGFSGVTINVATALTGSLAVGIGIDYTIHIIDAFKREYKNGGDYLRRTFAGAGKAILINAVSVGAGFGILTFSQFRVLSQFGGLITLSMAVSAVVSLTVIPVLITTVKPKFIYGQNSGQNNTEM